jgi:hypothetical protein
MTTPRNHPETTDLYQLCPEATSKGGTGLADTLGTTLGGFMAMISAMFPQMVYPRLVSTDLNSLMCKIWVPSLRHGA